MFEQIQYLWLLAVVPLLALLFLRSASKRKAQLEKFASSALWKNIVLGTSPARRKIKAIFLLTSATLIVLALGAPRWGFKMQQITRTGLDIMIVLDVSKSMLAQDVKPSRLERAKLEIKGLTQVLRGDRVGLVVFSGRAFYQCPLTLDLSAFNMFLEQADTTSIPLGGTNMTEAINTALKSFPETTDKSGKRLMIIFSDGEDHSGKINESIAKAKKRGVTIFTVPVGTQDGAPINIINTETGDKQFLKDKDGNIVLSKVNPAQMAEIASMTGGSIATLTGGNLPIEKIYENTISKMERAEIESMKQKIYEHRFVWPLLPAFLLLIFEACFSQRRKKDED